ncbi:hypothetical protein LINPERHAP1_LOCUS7052 [Linum perenne]
MKIAKKNLKNNISLDRYLLFFHSRPRIDLFTDELNQIVHLHGFRKQQRNAKKILTEALEELDLMDISRSTIKRSTEISSSASITLDELVDDLNKLDWQECRVTSVEAFYSQKRSSAPAADISLTQPADSSPQSVSALKKRKTVLVETVCSKDDAAPTTELAKLKKQFTAASKKSKTASYVQTESSKDDAAPTIHAATGPTTRKKQYAAPGK